MPAKSIFVLVAFVTAFLFAILAIVIFLEIHFTSGPSTQAQKSLTEKMYVFIASATFFFLAGLRMAV